MISSTGTESSCPLLFSDPSQKSSQSPLSPWFPSELCVHSTCDWPFLAQESDPVSSLQTLRAPVTWTWVIPGGGLVEREGSLSRLLPCNRPLPGVQLCKCKAFCGLWQNWAESWHLDSLCSACFLALMSGNPVAFRHPCSSCDPRDPEIMLSHLKSLLPKHL